MDVLLTNDDGYESPGLRSLERGLSEIANVTVVAPMEDQSGCGRLVNERVDIEDIPGGYAVSGTPVDCVIVGFEALDLSPDVVVSGCNIGGNLGRYVLGRSGTVSAAAEATFFDCPAIATSLYVPDDVWPLHGTREDFLPTVEATTFLLQNLDRIEWFTQGGYLNVNAPLETTDDTGLRMTRPTDHYAMTATRDGDGAVLDDVVWAKMAESPVTESVETDRGAVRNGHISISPLQVPTGVNPAHNLGDILSEYQSR